MSGGVGFDGLVFPAVQHTLSLLEPWGPVQNTAVVFSLHPNTHRSAPFPLCYPCQYKQYALNTHDVTCRKSFKEDPRSECLFHLLNQLLIILKMLPTEFQTSLAPCDSSRYLFLLKTRKRDGNGPLAS